MYNELYIIEEIERKKRWIMKVILQQQERDRLMESLSAPQREYIQHFVKRGKQTAFARELAASKGVQITPTMSDKEVEQFIDDWLLVDYIDAGPNYREHQQYRCQCGRTLRHVYVVRHQRTGEQIRFGKEHFEEHTMIPAHCVKAILDGFQSVDYEMDELLVKMSDGWRFEASFPMMPDSFVMPRDIGEAVALGMPLLDRQVAMLRRLLREHGDETSRRQREQQANRRFAEPRPPESMQAQEPRSATTAPKSKSKPAKEEPVQFTMDDLFGWLEEPEASPESQFDVPAEPPVQLSPLTVTESKSKQPNMIAGLTQGPLSSSQKQAVDRYLNADVESVRAMCELLIRDAIAPNDRFLTGKPRIFGELCLYLQQKEWDGELYLAGNDGKDDFRFSRHPAASLQ